MYAAASGVHPPLNLPPHVHVHVLSTPRCLRARAQHSAAAAPPRPWAVRTPTDSASLPGGDRPRQHRLWAWLSHDTLSYRLCRASQTDSAGLGDLGRRGPPMEYLFEMVEMPPLPLHPLPPPPGLGHAHLLPPPPPPPCEPLPLRSMPLDSLPLCSMPLGGMPLGDEDHMGHMCMLPCGDMMGHDSDMGHAGLGPDGMDDMDGMGGMDDIMAML